MILAAAAAALAGCSEDPEPAAEAEAPTTVAAPLLTNAGTWRRLGDGSFVRTASGVIANRRESDRCWPVGEGFDCLSLDAIDDAPSIIVVATRTRPAAYAEVPVAPPAVGFSCAIYPSGVIEQRLIRSEASHLQNDDTDGTLWTAADVGRLSSAADFVDCRALAARLAGNPIGALEAAGFDPREVMPTSS